MKTVAVSSNNQKIAFLGLQKSFYILILAGRDLCGKCGNALVKHNGPSASPIVI